MRKSLTDILHNGQQSAVASAWASAEAADDFEPLPAGEYVCHLVGIDLFNARTNGTPGAKMSFRVIEGGHAGRRVWLDCWLTPAAMAMSKRDLGKVGITDLSQLEKPVPPGIRCNVRVALRRDDDGTAFNRVRAFDVVGIDEPERDPFAPDTATPPVEQNEGGCPQ